MSSTGPALQTELTELIGCARPLQQAAFGSPANDLVVAVAEAGGIGTVGAPLLSGKQLNEALDDVLGRTDGAVAVNFIVPFLDLDAHGETLDVAAARARLVEFFFGWPDPSLVERVHAGGARALWQVGSTAEAEAAAEAGCDAVTAQGVEAGGHVRGRVGLLPLLGEVLERVEIPVIAAGGISTGRAMAGALATGAAGVRIGTRFVASSEAPFHPAYQQALVAAAAEEAVYSERFSNLWPDAPHRVLRSAIDAADASSEEIVGETLLAGESMPIERWAGIAPSDQTSGQIEQMALFAGQSVGSIGSIEPAAEIVASLCDDAARLLSR